VCQSTTWSVEPEVALKGLSMTDSPLEALFRALPYGQRMWLRTSGDSMWPLIRNGDPIHVERGGREALQAGDIALLVFPSGHWVAHWVRSVNPLVTESTNGVTDPVAVDVLGRVMAVRRGGLRIEFPRWMNRFARHLPRMARRARRLPLTRSLVRWLRR
jgi:hypothetical protein